MPTVVLYQSSNFVNQRIKFPFKVKAQSTRDMKYKTLVMFLCEVNELQFPFFFIISVQMVQHKQ